MTIVQRIKGICLKPKEEWQVIAAESSTTSGLFKNYVVPLAALGAVAGFIGMSLMGMAAVGLAAAVISFAGSLLTVYVLALIVDALAPRFGGEKNSSQALKIAVYSLTPSLVAGVLGIVPQLAKLGLLAAFYGAYLLYLGLPRLMKSPPEKTVAYTLAVFACSIGIFFVVGLVTGAIISAGIVSLPTH
jgi:Yip1 domain